MHALTQLQNLKFEIYGTSFAARPEDNGTWLIYNFNASSGILVGCDVLLDLADCLDGRPPTSKLQEVLSHLGVGGNS